MYQFVIYLLYFTIAGMFVVSYFSLNKWKSRLHTYLFFSTIANLVYNTGYLLELTSRDQESYVAALKMGYLGRVWVGFALVLFIAELCEVYIPEFFKIIAGITHVIIYFSILTIEHNDLYYNYMEFAMDGDFPTLIHTGGFLYYVQTVLNLIYLIIGWVVISRALMKEKQSVVRQKYLIMAMAIFAIGSTYLIYFFKLIPLARKFDVMIIGYAICTVLMLVAIIRYGMLDATTAAKNYVVDELSEAIIVVDPEDNITYFNKPASEMFPLLDNSKRDKETDGALIEDLKGMVGSGIPVNRNNRIYTARANGLMTDGTNVGTLYSFSDDSESYRYMEELKAQKKKADDANQAKTQFLANMSHEIRTPINGIMGFNEMIISECDDIINENGNKDPSLKESLDNINEYAGNIQNAGVSLLSIINDILDISKIEAGRMDIVNESYELGPMLGEVSNIIFIKAQEKGLSFVADIDETLPNRLYGDMVRIRQIITNILSNAVKYTDKGNIWMVVRGKPLVKDAEKMIILKIEIRDTGIGIRDEDREKLFSKFQRLDMKHNSTVEGTGLGLAITEQLLTMMGGTISVESKYGFGSVFRIELPQKVISEETVGGIKRDYGNYSPKTKTNKVLFKAPDAKILIVDDTEMNLMVTRGILKKTEMKIDAAGGGKEALEYTNKETYDLILMDQRMPGMDGTEALNHIREQEGGMNLDTPVICMTADAIIGARERYIKEGFTDYISKPFNSAELEKKIAQYLPPEKLIRD